LWWSSPASRSEASASEPGVSEKPSDADARDGASLAAAAEESREAKRSFGVGAAGFSVETASALERFEPASEPKFAPASFELDVTPASFVLAGAPDSFAIGRAALPFALGLSPDVVALALAFALALALALAAGLRDDARGCEGDGEPTALA